MSSSHPALPENPALDALNQLDEEAFTEKLSAVYEHSPWISRAAWNLRPFKSVSELRQSLQSIVENASLLEKLNLLRAHPDLAGRLATEDRLTRESTKEQRAAGLDALTTEQQAMISELNTAYWDKFSFPFIICARLNDITRILAAMQTRIHCDREQEISTAIAEVGLIASLRLKDIFEENSDS